MPYQQDNESLHAGAIAEPVPVSMHTMPETNVHYVRQHPFPFGPQPQPQFFYTQMPYPTFVAHAQQPVDEFYMPYSGAEYADFMDMGMMHDEMGESQEISTRPRLTKEQAEVLEAHFQANHKPSSQLKRELAIQTGLALQRVGNWFQNRRAKAKQQKRQEEYEAQNAPKDDDKDLEDFEDAEDVPAPKAVPVSTSSIITPTSSVPSPAKASNATTTSDSTSEHTSVPTPPTPVQTIENSKEASWNSLQRALHQAKAAQAQHSSHVQASMSPPELPQRSAPMQLPLRTNNHHTTTSATFTSGWQNAHVNGIPYPSPITLQDTSFDFGFENDGVEQQSSRDFVQDSFVITPEEFQEPLTTPKGVLSQQNDPATSLPSPGLSMPSYPGSRRPSTTDDLSANFGNVALAGTPPTFIPDRYVADVNHPPQNGPLDLAARRKRPRPAALTSASLRSRSYGAMTSVSPTFRQGMMSPQGPHSVRHVKSAGQNLHARFSGIRKASSAQKSPMCAATFAEAEALNKIMTQQAIATTPLEELPEPLFSPAQMVNGHLMDPDKHPFLTNMDIPTQYSMQPPQNLAISTASPPVTPMLANFMSRGPSQQSLMPPASAPPQYATFPDYTPPYSAGPLTNSSWSDAPMTSPEVPSFPATYMSSLAFPQQCDGANGQFQQFVLRSDNQSEIEVDYHLLDQKKTEFYIQEFPNQREEHAHVAQQLAQQKPKNYVFANTAPQDYNGA